MTHWDDKRLALATVVLAIGVVTEHLTIDREKALLGALANRYLPGAEEGVVGRPCQPLPPENGGSEAQYAAAYAAGHAAGMDDICRSTKAYTAARIKAGVHPDSQLEHDWDMGWRAGQDELATLCQKAETAGRRLGEQRIERMSATYKINLAELTGGRYITGPIAKAFDAGFSSAAPKARQAGPKVKYRNAGGSTWSGRGLQPAWIREALSAGRALDEFEVQS